MLNVGPIKRLGWCLGHSLKKHDGSGTRNPPPKIPFRNRGKWAKKSVFAARQKRASAISVLLALVQNSVQ